MNQQKHQQRIQPDPNNTHWLSSNIGKTLLQKLGWTGGALGLTTTGILNPIKPKLKNNSSGLGFKNTEIFNSDFNDLFKKFNNEQELDEQELKGQVSHREKFKKQKNVKMWREEDVEMIFGRRKVLFFGFFFFWVFFKFWFFFLGEEECGKGARRE